MPPPSPTTLPFPRLLASVIDGRAQNTRYKQSQFHRLQSALLNHIPEIKSAIQSDSSHTTEEITAEICLALKELRSHYDSLNMEDDLEREYRVARGLDNAENGRGLGIVYIIPGVHGMFFSVLAALTAGVAAGNCVVLELTKNTMSLPPLLRKILNQSLDADTFAIAESRPESSFFESPDVLIVNQTRTADAIPTTPLTLTSPVQSKTIALVDSTADLQSAAESLVAARFSFGGKSTYALDLVLVQEFVLKEFVEAVILASSKYLSGSNGSAEERSKSGNVNPRRASPGLSLLDQAYKDPNARVLISGSEWGVVEVGDRGSGLLRVEGKVSERVLLLHAVSSLDDGVDFCARFGTLAATYAFAAPDSAKYITQFIDAHISFINHLPIDMLIGPALPTNTPSPWDRRTRYTPSQFQLPRPQYITPSQGALSLQTILHNPGSKEALKTWNDAVQLLPATGQKNGPRIGFFEQGIITGGVITLCSFLGVLGTVGYYTVCFLRRF